uniref:Nudix hydrolase domain-containing protein n=1 Tax=Pseudonaja textilis TaxID=8673 RepID=A0A670Z2L8_PSETE
MRGGGDGVGGGGRSGSCGGDTGPQAAPGSPEAASRPPPFPDRPAPRLRCAAAEPPLGAPAGPMPARSSFLAPVFLPLGGTLKSRQQADAESLQARWWDRESPALPLRSRDILPLMDLALQYRAGPRHPPVLPAELPCASVCQRFLLVFTGGGGRDDDSLWVLLDTTGGPHLPLATSSPSASKPGRRLAAALPQLLQRCRARPEVAVRLQGLLGLQHLGREPGRSDGVCFNVVATVGSEGSAEELAPPALQEPAFTWWEVEEPALKSQVLQRLRGAPSRPGSLWTPCS